MFRPLGPWMRVLTFGVGVVFAVLISTPGHAQINASPSPAPAGADQGRFVYMRDCAWCHGNEGGGTARAPALDGAGAAGAHFYLSSGRMPIEKSVQQAERSRRAYDDRTIDALVKFVASLGDGPAIPRVNPQRGNLARGAKLYLENCAACHGTTMAGAALTQDVLAPALYESTPTQIAESIKIGPVAMPVLSPPLTERDIDSVARYILTVRASHNRGGATLGRLGPVTEGSVAWIIGLGSLLLVIGWIGTRSKADEQ